MNAGETSQWCAGVPQTGERGLSAEDRRELEAAIRRSRHWIIGALAGPWALAGLGLVIALTIPQTEVGAAATALVVIAAVIAPAPAILIARDHWRVIRGLRRDLAAGTVEVYAGEVSPLLEEDATFERLRREGGVEKSRTLEFEVLSESGFVWSNKGRRTRKWLPAPRNQAYAPDPEEDVPELEAVPMDAEVPAGMSAGSRWLTEAEREELLGYARRYRKGIPFAAVLTAWASLPLLLGGVPPMPQRIQWSLLCAVALYADFWLFREWRFSRALRRDVDEPVIIVDSQWKELDDEGARRVELLGVSQAVWRSDGKPSAWRRIGQ